MIVNQVTTRPHRKQRGYVMVTMLLSLTVLLAFLGLTVDVGYDHFVKTTMQTAADAAALGGAQELHASGSANVVAAARGDAAVNGFTNGVSSVTVTVNNPPATGYSIADSSAVEVLISQSVPTLFMQVLGFSSTRIQARSVARLGSGGTTCFYALNPSMSGALLLSAGGVTITFACGAMVNSTSSTAIDFTGGGSTLRAPYTGVTGNYATNGNGNAIIPLPSTGVTAAKNPFSSLPRPTVGVCAAQPVWQNGANTISPGTYCNLSMGNGGHTFTFSPGVYIFCGGLTFGGGDTITGNGVTFYNSSTTGHPYQPFNFANNATVNLTAPTTGSYAGILLYQDPTVVSSLRNNLAGGANLNLTGTLYFPTTGIDFSNGVSATYTILVADNVNFAGGVTLNNNYSSLPGGSPIKGNVGLSE